MSNPWTYHPAATDFERSLDFTTGEPIKQNRQRTVSRIIRPEGEWFVKVCRLDGPRAWFRDLFRGAKAKLEFTNALELARRSIPAIEPIAWQGRSLPGESVVVSRAVRDAIPLEEALEKTTQTSRHRLTVALGQFFARMYREGVSHPDPHPGNLLVRFEHSEPRFTLLDLHAVHVGPPLTNEQIVQNLVLFNRWFALRTQRSDRLRFLRQITDDDSLPREIERRTLESNLRFWRRRFSRYFGNNREYHRIRGSTLRGMAMKHVPQAIITQLQNDPDRFFDGVIPIKTSKSSTVIRVSFDGLGDGIFKCIPIRSTLSPLKNLLRPSIVRKSWMYGQTVHDRWLPTPRPLVMLHRYRFGLPAEGYLLMEAIPHSQTLHDWVMSRPSRKELLTMAEQLGRLLRTMHERGVAHRDLKSSNILVDRDQKAYLIDLVGVTTSMNVPEAIRVRDIARLAASFLDSEFITNAIRLRFLQTYRLSEWKRVWQAIRDRVRVKVAQNRKRGRVLG